MRRTIINVVVLALLLLTVGVTASMRRDPTLPNYSFMREMVDSIPYDAYAKNPILPGGRTQQVPIPGAIARGQVPLHYGATPEEALRAGQELQSPFAGALARIEQDEAIRAKVSEGAEVYRVHCLPCHGASGQGDGTVALRGYPPPPPLTAEKTINMADGQLFHVVTFGQGNMPGYGAQVRPDDRWKVVLYLRSLQQAAASAAGGTQQ